MTWSIGVDVGGTFTDFFALDDASGQVHVAKLPSTPADPAQAILQGIAILAERHGVAPGAIARLSHGTTVATNALIQRRGGRVAMVTTRGFRDLLEIGRQVRPHMYDLNKDFPPPLVPREHRLECGERILADGSVHRQLDAEEVAALVEQVRATGAESCAVCFLFAFLNPAHERAMAEALRRSLPDLHLSVSSEVQPEFREYERFSTAVINAYLQPVLSRYVANLHTGVAGVAPQAKLGINQSSGGLMSAERAMRFPIRTALSGPAAGVVGAIYVARRSGEPNVVSFDMGGTSTDVALIRDYQATVAFNRDVAEFPIRLPMVDIHTIGAGGGSIGWFDRDGLLKVGPASAGAVPGPACYGLGGKQPTVSDANLVLGRLSSALLGGRMALDRGLAEQSLRPIAERLGYGIERTAHGILGIVVANMVRAIRTISVERGHDPRGFTLMPLGGAGPLHARDVAVSLGIRRILVPPAPGILCAQGLLVSDLKEDFVLSSNETRVEDASIGRIRDAVATLIGQAAEWCAAEGVPADRRRLELTFDMRYVGQNFELTVPLASDAGLGRSAVPEAPVLRQRFFAAHETAYGFANSHDPVEVINLRLTARGMLYRERPADDDGRAAASPEPSAHRPVHFGVEAPQDTPIFDRSQLSPGQVLFGPAIVEQLDSTTPIFPGDRAEVYGNLCLVIEVRHGE